MTSSCFIRYFINRAIRANQANGRDDLSSKTGHSVRMNMLDIDNTKRQSRSTDGQCNRPPDKLDRIKRMPKSFANHPISPISPIGPIGPEILSTSFVPIVSLKKSSLGDRFHCAEHDNGCSLSTIKYHLIPFNTI